jgi:hypothetical protein
MLICQTTPELLFNAIRPAYSSRKEGDEGKVFPLRKGWSWMGSTTRNSTSVGRRTAS